MQLPADFIIQMQARLGDAYDAFIAALSETPPTSIRWNTQKNGPQPDNALQIPWCPTGMYLPERPVFTLDPLFHAGAYYVQEPSSMIVAEAVSQTLDLSQPLRALDLCAAPGGKSTLLAQVLPAESFLLCNEVIRTRYPVLRENLLKWGCPGAHAASHDSREYTRLEGFFDLVLVDAPCSGEGLFRKDKKAVLEWSLSNVQLCAARQKRILADAVKTVRPGGVLLYCTCTYNDEENEQNAHWLMQEFGLEPIPLRLPVEWGVAHQALGYQMYPHRVRGEGFYIACFRRVDGALASLGKRAPWPKWKPLSATWQQEMGQWLKTPEQFAFFQSEQQTVYAILQTQVEDNQRVATQLYRSNLGIEMGVIKGKDFVPSHALALSTAVRPDLPTVDLSKEEALLFLKKEPVSPTVAPRGWATARYEGYNLGWLKGLGNRMNNYLPKEWRIRMELPSEN